MRNCDTCTSPFREEIDDLIRKGWVVKDVLRHLMAKYPGSKLPSYDSLCNHAKNHVRKLLQITDEMVKKRSKAIEQEIKSSIQAVNQLKTNLQLCSDLLQQALKEGIDDPKRREEIGNLIWRANQTIEMLLKYQSQIETRELSEDEIVQRLLFCLSDFDQATVNRILERWKLYAS